MAQTLPTVNRNELAATEQERASLYLRRFDPHRYTTYYRRIYNPMAYLDEVGEDKIAELIEHGNGLLNVAEALDIGGSTLRRWVASGGEARVAKIKLAHQFAGNAYAYKAERALLDARGMTKEEITLAGKLAEHYRWMATKLDRDNFGDVKDAPTNLTPIQINLNMGGEQVAPETAKPAVVANFIKLSDE